ncbi:CRISPR system precrRNA processing endoribonuclease RAMP protein Cas6 [Aeromonas veronii]|uniref:CRISPR system precrRNA processing endoribonuclease RAMP protein Cas6 n=1 Tax=Aeromonas veronii TaxID=654 RepID=UPI002443D3BB|nr:CRISPR system precrRNA processing endoribonuclease RAMP protein Cas6 [Aeromonas veronii]
MSVKRYKAILTGWSRSPCAGITPRAPPLTRYSARQRQHHSIEGLRGRWAYQGDIQLLIPWLALGEWIQLGNKTSFGYGAIEWQLACRP